RESGCTFAASAAEAPVLPRSWLRWRVRGRRCLHKKLRKRKCETGQNRTAVERIGAGQAADLARGLIDVKPLLPRVDDPHQFHTRAEVLVNLRLDLVAHVVGANDFDTDLRQNIPRICRRDWLAL